MENSQKGKVVQKQKVYNVLSSIKYKKGRILNGLCLGFLVPHWGGKHCVWEYEV